MGMAGHGGGHNLRGFPKTQEANGFRRDEKTRSLWSKPADWL